MKPPLYQETIGKATIQIVEYGYSWIVSMDEEGKHFEKTFNPSPYPEREPYALAIACYDTTVTALQKKYKAASDLGKPDFIKAATGKTGTPTKSELVVLEAWRELYSQGKTKNIPSLRAVRAGKTS